MESWSIVADCFAGAANEDFDCNIMIDITIIMMINRQVSWRGWRANLHIWRSFKRKLLSKVMHENATYASISSCQLTSSQLIQSALDWGKTNTNTNTAYGYCNFSALHIGVKLLQEVLDRELVSSQLRLQVATIIITSWSSSSPLLNCPTRQSLLLFIGSLHRLSIFPCPDDKEIQLCATKLQTREKLEGFWQIN